MLARSSGSLTCINPVSKNDGQNPSGNVIDAVQQLGPSQSSGISNTSDTSVLDTMFNRFEAAAGLLSCFVFSVPAVAAGAEAAQALARHSNSFKCHAIDKKKDGPAYKEVATRSGNRVSALVAAKQ
jgi:hypothetical protein